jgi:F1F0 ATPase subunit 2
MDEERMSFLSFACPPVWAMVFGAAAHLMTGIVLGILYFRSLWWNTCRFAKGGRVTTMIALMISRYALLGGLLTLVSLEGVLPLLMIALGVLIARSVALRRVREATS